jgi:hypothetical protein
MKRSGGAKRAFYASDSPLERAGFEHQVLCEGLPEDRDDGPSLPGPRRRKCRRGIKVRPPLFEAFSESSRPGRCSTNSSIRPNSLASTGDRNLSCSRSAVVPIMPAFGDRQRGGVGFTRLQRRRLESEKLKTTRQIPVGTPDRLFEAQTTTATARSPRKPPHSRTCPSRRLRQGWCRSPAASASRRPSPAG